MSARHRLQLLLCFVLAACALPAQEPEARTAFHIKYIADGAVYLDGGHSAGLAEGMKLTVKWSGKVGIGGGNGEVVATRMIAQLKVISVAETSAVCEVISSSGEMRVGDMAYLATEDVRTRQVQQAAANARRYAQVISFTEGDPLDEEKRAAVPRPPSPEVNRIRGRVGVEYSSMRNRDAGGSRSLQVGLVVRADMTRIGGSYWNFTGYWRGRLTSRGTAQQETLTDLINRTYQLSLTYNNPQSPWVIGLGRTYLPWASSLNVIDGGYVGRRTGRHFTLGVFAGSTPDPTAWNYNPNRQLGGGFANFEGGSFESLRLTSTIGAAISRIQWKPDRQFEFAENGLFYKRSLTVYHSLEADLLRAPPATTPSSGMPPASGAAATSSQPVVSRSYLTARVQPHHRFSFDVSHNYFRELPTFDSRLVGTGLVDKYLFQGLSAGVRLDLPYRVSIYSSAGRSQSTGDARKSWNQMYGLTLGEIWRTGVRADLRYSKFDSSFGRGDYKALSLSRIIGEGFRLEFQAGQQDFASPLSQQNRAQFLNSSVEWFLGAHFFLGSGFTVYRGETQNYDQWFFNLGYRY